MAASRGGSSPSARTHGEHHTAPGRHHHGRRGRRDRQRRQLEPARRAAASTARSTARPGRSCSRSAGGSAAARPATRRSPAPAAAGARTSSTRSGRSGAAAGEGEPELLASCYRRADRARRRARLRARRVPGDLDRRVRLSARAGRARGARSDGRGDGAPSGGCGGALLAVRAGGVRHLRRRAARARLRYHSGLDRPAHPRAARRGRRRRRLRRRAGARAARAAARATRPRRSTTRPSSPPSWASGASGSRTSAGASGCRRSSRSAPPGRSAARWRSGWATPSRRAIRPTLRERARALHPLRVVCATDGNHGRAVAHIAALLGLDAEVLVPAGTVAARIAAIEAEGARVHVVDGDYDAAQERSAELARRRRHPRLRHVLAGQRADPARVTEGYGTIFAELEEQLDAAPDVAFMPVGVGALAAAAVEPSRAPWRAARRRSSPPAPPARSRPPAPGGS